MKWIIYVSCLNVFHYFKMLPNNFTHKTLGLQLSNIMRQAAESIWFEIYRGVVDPGPQISFFSKEFLKNFNFSWEFPQKISEDLIFSR